MHYLQLVRDWICQHPAQSIVYAWMILNVIWAQCPQPKNPTVARLWNFSHALLQLCVTHASANGTFTLPWLIKAAISALSTAPAPASPPANTPSTAKDAGDLHDDTPS